MKLAPANQTFIPASTPGRRSFAVTSSDEASSQLGQALRTVVSGTQLRSVTIVASRPETEDNIVVVQAQYAPELDSFTDAHAAAPKLIPRQPSASGRGAAYLSPVEQYARTQSGASKSPPLVDVRA